MRTETHNVEAVHAERRQVLTPIEIDDDPLHFKALDIGRGVDERDLASETGTIKKIRDYSCGFHFEQS